MLSHLWVPSANNILTLQKEINSKGTEYMVYLIINHLEFGNLEYMQL